MEAFDTLAFAKKLKNAGYSDVQAEAMAEVQAEVFRGMLDSSLATKTDLKEELGGLRSDLHKMESGLKAEIAGLRSDLKEELGGLRSDLHKMESGLKAEIAGLRSDLKEELGGLRSDLKEELGGLRSDLHKMGSGLYRALISQTVVLIVAMVGIIWAFKYFG